MNIKVKSIKSALATTIATGTMVIATVGSVYADTNTTLYDTTNIKNSVIGTYVSEENTNANVKGKGNIGITKYKGTNIDGSYIGTYLNNERTVISAESNKGNIDIESFKETNINDSAIDTMIEDRKNDIMSKINQ